MADIGCETRLLPLGESDLGTLQWEEMVFPSSENSEHLISNNKATFVKIKLICAKCLEKLWQLYIYMKWSTHE